MSESNSLTNKITAVRSKTPHGSYVELCDIEERDKRKRRT